MGVTISRSPFLTKISVILFSLNCGTQEGSPNRPLLAHGENRRHGFFRLILSRLVVELQTGKVWILVGKAWMRHRLVGKMKATACGLVYVSRGLRQTKLGTPSYWPEGVTWKTLELISETRNLDLVDISVINLIRVRAQQF